MISLLLFWVLKEFFFVSLALLDLLKALQFVSGTNIFFHSVLFWTPPSSFISLINRIHSFFLKESYTQSLHFSLGPSVLFPPPSISVFKTFSPNASTYSTFLSPPYSTSALLPLFLSVTRSLLYLFTFFSRSSSVLLSLPCQYSFPPWLYNFMSLTDISFWMSICCQK